MLCFQREMNKTHSFNINYNKNHNQNKNKNKKIELTRPMTLVELVRDVTRSIAQRIDLQYIMFLKKIHKERISVCTCNIDAHSKAWQYCAADNTTANDILFISTSSHFSYLQCNLNHNNPPYCFTAKYRIMFVLCTNKLF